MAAIDIAARVRGVALAEVDAQCFGEDYGLDVAVSLAPTERGVAVVYTIITTAPSPLLGRPALANVSQIASPSPTHEQIKATVTTAMRDLRELTRRVREQLPAGTLR